MEEFTDLGQYKVIIKDIDPKSPLCGFRTVYQFSNKEEFDKVYTPEFLKQKKIEIIAADFMALDMAISVCVNKPFPQMPEVKEKVSEKVAAIYASNKNFGKSFSLAAYVGATDEAKDEPKSIPRPRYATATG